MLNDILLAFGINADQYSIYQLGSGIINHTWKLTDGANEGKFILQRLNKSIFRSPYLIAENIEKIKQYLTQHQPSYLFAVPLPTPTGETLVKHNDEYYRIFPFIKNSVTVTTVQTPDEAFEAANQFGQFTRLLDQFDITDLHYTLPGFHDMSKRFANFQQAIKTGNADRINSSQQWIDKACLYQHIAKTYEDIVAHKLIPLRVIHHDTKISNVLFEADGKGLCVIDLDTVMPGYFISDVGDMMRTYLSPVNEEEKDLVKIAVREDFFKAIAEGYLKQMGGVLTKIETSLFVYSGKFMIYMQALRFLTDYLNNDVYYGASYPDHNLVRAQNQLTLLEKYLEAQDKFQQIVDTCINE